MDRITQDKYHGQGGTYEVVNGERRLVKGSTLAHHADGDAARDKDGKVIGAVDANAKPDPAMAEAVPMPWDSPPAAKPTEPKRGPAATDANTTKGS